MEIKLDDAFGMVLDALAGRKCGASTIKLAVRVRKEVRSLSNDLGVSKAERRLDIQDLTQSCYSLIAWISGNAPLDVVARTLKFDAEDMLAARHIDIVPPTNFLHNVTGDSGIVDTEEATEKAPIDAAWGAFAKEKLPGIMPLSVVADTNAAFRAGWAAGVNVSVETIDESAV